MYMLYCGICSNSSPRSGTRTCLITRPNLLPRVPGSLSSGGEGFTPLIRGVKRAMRATLCNLSQQK